MRRILIWGSLLACCACLPTALTAQSSGTSPYSATPQRPTFTSDTSTTAPGTLEIEFGAATSTSSGGFLFLPSTLKFTPDVRRGLFRRAELSLSFDSVKSVATGGGRRTEFGDTVTVALRKPVYPGRVFSLALTPQASFFTRGERGARLGATAHFAVASGLNALVGNFTWTSATSPSPGNPSQKYDIAADFSRALGTTGVRSRLAIFAGVLCEKPKHRDTSVSLGQGITYRVRANWVLDLAIQEVGLAAGRRGYQILAGFTVNVGRVQSR